MEWIRRLHPHFWRDISVNRYGIVTEQECRICPVKRYSAKGEPILIDGREWPSFNFWWLYIDGTRKPDERVFKHFTPPTE